MENAPASECASNPGTVAPTGIGYACPIYSAEFARPPRAGQGNYNRRRHTVLQMVSDAP